MRFGPVEIDEALGRILGHNVFDQDGRRVLRKGRAIQADDLDLLRRLGKRVVYAAELETHDVDEDQAALRITEALMRGPIRLSGPRTGRVNLHAETTGVLRVDLDRLNQLNQILGVTLATGRADSVARAGRMVATTKILPYALPASRVEKACDLVTGGPIVTLEPLAERRCALLVAGSETGRERLVAGFESAIGDRLAGWGSRLDEVEFLRLGADDAAPELAERIEVLAATCDLLILAGETAIQDRHDLAPRAVELAGGEVISYGAPVDPGNLLMLGQLGKTAILGAPGCARSPKRNIVDLVLPRLLVGERLRFDDIAVLGHGGLLEDVPERPLPRSQI